MSLDLHTDSPERLIAESDPRALTQALMDLAAWDDRALKVTDTLLKAWVLDVCLRPDDREGLKDVDRALHVALERTADRPPVTWAARWTGYASLLEDRALRYTEPGEIDLLWQRKHIPALVAVLARTGDAMPQNRLRISLENQAEPVKLSPERMSQLLRHLEEHGLITRARSGRENLIALTQSGRAVYAQRQRQPQSQRDGTHTPSGREGMGGDTTQLDAELLKAA